MKKSLAVVAVVALMFSACKKDSVSCTGTAKSFATDANPVIQATCATSGCHSTGSSSGPGALVTYTQIFNSKSTIKSQVSSGAMPQGSTLTSAQKEAIVCWIDQGAPNN